MDSFPILHFPSLKLKIVKTNNGLNIICPIRKKKFLLTPEEWVRQHVIAYLIQVKKYPLSRISVEKTLKYNAMIKRWDIAVFDSNFDSFLLVECKSARIKLGNDTLSQVLTYQSTFRGKFISITNGLDHKIFDLQSKDRQLKEIKDFPDFNFE